MSLATHRIDQKPTRWLNRKPAFIGLAAFLLVLSLPATATSFADAVYVNAQVYTVDENNMWADSFAIKDGKFVAVGSRNSVASMASTATPVIDLKKRMVMPGIHDTHLHSSVAGELMQLQCYFRTNDLAEVKKILRECAAKAAPGEWIRGGQWTMALFEPGVSPKKLLDEIVPDNPVFLMDWSWHNGWVNSKALERLSIGRETPDPKGGVIVRDEATGETTGILMDNATYSVMRGLPAYATAQRASALEWSLNFIAQFGVTTVKEAIVTREIAEAFTELSRRGGLPVRVNTAMTWKIPVARSHEDEIALLAEHERFATNRVSTGFAKIMLDGVPIPPKFTAAMLEPYLPNENLKEGWRGELIFDPETLNADVGRLHGQGFSIKIHSTGDRAVRAALDAFEQARASGKHLDTIHEVSHAELIHPDDIPRFAELNVAAEMCPILWHPIHGLDWAAWIGPERTVWPVRNLVESGALVTYGSDWSVVPTPNPWPGIEAMVTRADPYTNGSETLSAEQAVDLATTIRIFTLNGAHANGAGATSGSIEVGKDADFIVLDRNIFEVPITDVSETGIVFSAVGGIPVVNTLEQ